MKRYSISIGREVNERASKTGIAYHYEGRTDDAEKYIAENHGKYRFGFQIKDSVTKKIIYSEGETEEYKQMINMIRNEWLGKTVQYSEDGKIYKVIEVTENGVIKINKKYFDRDRMAVSYLKLKKI